MKRVSQKGTHIAEIFDELGIGDDLVEITNAAAKSLTKEFAITAVTSVGRDWLAELAPEIAGAVAGGVVRALLKVLLRASDKVTAKLDKLLRASLETGLRMVAEAISLSSDSPAQCEFRDRRLGDAITELERAWTLAGDSPTCDADRFYVRLTQGMAAKYMTGGAEYASLRLIGCADVLEAERRSSEDAAAAMSAQREGTLKKAAEHKRSSEASKFSVGFGGAASMGHANMAQYLREDVESIDYNIRVVRERLALLVNLIGVLRAAAQTT